jgi:hypothetical protein
MLPIADERVNAIVAAIGEAEHRKNHNVLKCQTN